MWDWLRRRTRTEPDDAAVAISALEEAKAHLLQAQQAPTAERQQAAFSAAYASVAVVERALQPIRANAVELLRTKRFSETQRSMLTTLVEGFQDQFGDIRQAILRAQNKAKGYKDGDMQLSKAQKNLGIIGTYLQAYQRISQA